MNKERIILDDADRLLSLDEVSARLKTSQSNVARLVRSGLLTTLRFGNYKRVRKVTLNEFLRRYDGQDLLAVLEGAEKREHIKRFWPWVLPRPSASASDTPAGRPWPAPTSSSRTTSLSPATRSGTSLISTAKTTRTSATPIQTS